MARLVSQAGIAKIVQLAEKLRQRVVPTPLLRKTCEIFYTGALVMGKNFIMFFFANLESLFIVLSTSPTRKSVEHTRRRIINEVN